MQSPFTIRAFSTSPKEVFSAPVTEQSFKDALAEYDSKYSTLIDYVTLIGISTSEINEVIQAIKKGSMFKKLWTPSVLSKIPNIDKPSIAFPSTVTEVNIINIYILIVFVI